jgi:transposase-like protein
MHRRGQVTDEKQPSDEEKASDYEKAPTVPRELQPLYEAVMAVQAGKLSVSEAARQLGLSRNRFQTRMHRALRGLVVELQDKPQGRPAKPAREAQLEEQLRQLQKENTRLQSRVDMVDRMLGVASDLMRGKVKLTGRQTGANPSPESGSDDKDEPDGVARAQLEGAKLLRALGLSAALVAAAVGCSASTLRRRARREDGGQRLLCTRGPASGSSTSPALIAAAEATVREMKGLIGAEALAHKVPGLSRRKAAEVKAGTLTAMENERKSAAARITVTVPGVIRGFDAMHVGDNYLLIAADAKVPYRTLIYAVSSYDSASVAAALERDIELNGAPLVYRMDRASCHQTDEVRAVLDRNGVLVLHGPPRHPQYYGQLERQNREHRAWLNQCGELTLPALISEASQMQAAWNCTLPRRSLAWSTSSEVWSQRPTLVVDRRALREEVDHRAARILRQLEVRGGHADLARRLAIEATLTKYGWLIRRGGAEC